MALKRRFSFPVTVARAHSNGAKTFTNNMPQQHFIRMDDSQLKLPQNMHQRVCRDRGLTGLGFGPGSPEDPRLGVLDSNLPHGADGGSMSAVGGDGILANPEDFGAGGYSISHGALSEMIFPGFDDIPTWTSRIIRFGTGTVWASMLTT
jgi:hypothetical protein